MNRGERERLPNRRRTVTQKAVVGDLSIYTAVSRFPDGRLAEMFIRLSQRDGSAFRTLMDTFAVVLSIAIQHGVPPLALASAMRGVRFDPSGPVEGDDRVRDCTSIVDYLGRVIEVEVGA